jgi:hypothetical protein
VTNVEYQVRSVRSTGRRPDAVAASVAAIAIEVTTDGWELIYNGSASGYLLLAYERRADRR